MNRCPSFSDIASLSLRVKALKHEYSSTRRISQDLQSRKPGANRGPQLDSSLTTLAGGNSPIQTRTTSPTLRRRTSTDLPIPETPQHLSQPDKDRASFVDSHALTEATNNHVLNAAGLLRPKLSQSRTARPATPEQLQEHDDSSVSQINEDIRRRNSLNDMVSPSSFGTYYKTYKLFS